MHDLDGHMNISNALRHDASGTSGSISTVAEPSTKLAFNDKGSMIRAAKNLQRDMKRLKRRGEPFEVPYAKFEAHLPAPQMGQLVDLRGSMPYDIEDQAYDLINPLFVPRGLKPVISTVSVGDITRSPRELPVIVIFTVKPL
jgi:hypothetical protein